MANLFIKTLLVKPFNKNFQNVILKALNNSEAANVEDDKDTAPEDTKAKTDKKQLYINLSEEHKEKIEDYITSITDTFKNSTPINIEEWSENNGLPTQGMIKLLNKNNLPVFKLGKFKGAYPEHLKEVLNKEFKRQFRVKTRNKAASNFSRFISEI